jgi:diadenosine tetraphosphate (Ap4A) HIT family hydrolase
MDEIAKQGHCPFCAENIDKYHKNPILKEGKYWLLTDNQWPYPKVKHQLLAIYKTHIEHIKEMDAEAGAELITLFKEETLKRNIPGGGIIIRFGSDPKGGNYGSTVLHIHAHLIEPDLDALGEAESFKFKVKIGQSKDCDGAK